MNGRVFRELQIKEVKTGNSSIHCNIELLNQENHEGYRNSKKN